MTRLSASEKLQPPVRHHLDWSALTPTCAACSQKSGRLDDASLCPACRPVVAEPAPQPDDDDASAPVADPSEDDALTGGQWVKVRGIRVWQPAGTQVRRTPLGPPKPTPQREPEPTFAERLTRLGVKPRDVNVWAIAAGLRKAGTRGMPSRALVEQYATAHPTAPTSTRGPAT